MASLHEIFGDSDPDESFEGFRDSDINDSAVILTVEEDDDEDDISVKSLSSDEEKSEESTDESSSDNQSNNDVAPPAGGNVRGIVEEKVVTWSERRTDVNFPCYSEMPGPTVTLDADKVELDFFCLDVQFRFVCVDSSRDKPLCRAITMAERQTRHEMEANDK